MQGLRRFTLIACGMVGLSLLYGVVRAMPYGMIVFYGALFAFLKPVLGMRTWWHALAAAVAASALYLLYPRVVPVGTDTESLALRAISAAVAGLLVAVALWQHLRRRRLLQ
jgi:hypothetical protein